jgi:hypothetical protein
MGMAAADVEGRLAASLGELDAVAPCFAPALDVPNGGVLCALPALLAVGLLEGVERHLALPKGYYGLDSLLMLLAFMALARLRSVESLRYCAPGEWGNLLGLDRVPEVRTLRAKIQLLARAEQPASWSAALCERWMAAVPEQAGVLYIDGHVRFYHGSQSQLPRHYVARQRLCLRATTDYWVKAMDGQPFFLVNQTLDPGLIQVIEQEIVPRPDRPLPAPPQAEQLEAAPLRHRFTLVFDREGYSRDFLGRMKAQRIACLTYHKYLGEDWAQEEFTPRRYASPMLRSSPCNWPNGALASVTGCGYASCASAASGGIKPPSCAPTIAAQPPPGRRPCSPAARRKTSSSMPASTTAWSAWPTIAPR